MKKEPEFIDSSKVRKSLKKVNLREAHSHFPYRVNLHKIGCTVEDAQKWLIDHRYRSWKQKGLNADYYYNNWSVIFFKDKNILLEFILCLSKS
jgi:hypothetical protein